MLSRRRVLRSSRRLTVCCAQIPLSAARAPSFLCFKKAGAPPEAGEAPQTYEAEGSPTGDEVGDYRFTFWMYRARLRRPRCHRRRRAGAGSTTRSAGSFQFGRHLVVYRPGTARTARRYPAYGGLLGAGVQAGHGGAHGEVAGACTRSCAPASRSSHTKRMKVLRGLDLSSRRRCRTCRSPRCRHHSSRHRPSVGGEGHGEQLDAVGQLVVVVQATSMAAFQQKAILRGAVDEQGDLLAAVDGGDQRR